MFHAPLDKLNSHANLVSQAFEPEQLGKMVARDARQIQSMIRLINDMVDVSRIRSGKLSIRPAETELSALLKRIVHDLAHRTEAHMTSDRPGLIMRRRLLDLLKDHNEPEVTKHYAGA